MFRRFAVVLALSVPLATAAGCGSGRLGAQEYIARADKQCQRVITTANRFGPPKNLAQQVTKTSRVVAVGQEALLELRRLRAPRELERPAREFIRMFARRLAVQRQIVAASRAHDQPRLDGLGAARALINQRADFLAAEAHLDRCGSPSD